MSLGNLLFGALVDIDHLFEYFKFQCYRLKFKKVLQVFFEADFDKIYLFLHSFELASFLWLWLLFFDKRNMALFGIAIGYSQHLLLDFASNKAISPFSYFLLFRIFNNFKVNKIFNIIGIRKTTKKRRRYLYEKES